MRPDTTGKRPVAQPSSVFRGAEALRAHALLDETRCAGWLAATGMRPHRGVLGYKEDYAGRLTGPQVVHQGATPNPTLRCEMHPVHEDLPEW